MPQNTTDPIGATPPLCSINSFHHLKLSRSVSLLTCTLLQPTTSFSAISRVHIYCLLFWSSISQSVWLSSSSNTHFLASLYNVDPMHSIQFFDLCTAFCRAFGEVQYPSTSESQVIIPIPRAPILLSACEDGSKPFLCNTPRHHGNWSIYTS